MRSSNWSEVNAVRWREGQLQPMGGQAQFTNVVMGVDQYVFASRCKMVHGWHDVAGVYHIAYLCESNLYVDTGGTLVDITPTEMIPPTGISGGYGDGPYNDGTYGTPRSIPGSVAITRIPDAYSLDNFGAILYAMTSADGRLFIWDPSVSSAGQFTSTATAAFTTSSPVVFIATSSPLIVAGNAVYDLTTNHVLGTVLSVAVDNHSANASKAFVLGATRILMSSTPARVIPGMAVTDTTRGLPLGTILTYGVESDSGYVASDAWTTATSIIPMSSTNPGFVLPGMSVLDTTSGSVIGTVLSYPTIPNISDFDTAVAAFTTASTTINMGHPNTAGVLPGHNVRDASIGGLPLIGTVASWTGNILTLTTNSRINSFGVGDSILFSGTNLTLAANAAFASSGSGDALTISGIVLKLTSPSPFASAGAADTMLISGGSQVTMTANSAFASSGASDTLQFKGNIAVVKQPDSDRGPVPHGRSFVVTPDRFIMIFGSTQDGTSDGGSARRVAWCDQENPGAWDYVSQTSQAGFFDLEPASPIICGLASRLGILVWTAQKVYASKFLGLPYVYNFTELADGTTPWSPQSMVTTSSLSLWMSEQGVFSYDGTSVLPVQCLIRPWIDDDFDPVLVREFAFAAHLAEFNEWWWFFPQLVNNGKNTRAAVYNYKEGWWTQVRMTRSAGTTSSYTSHPIFADDLIAFQHEVGTVYVNADLPFAETFDLNLTSGARLTTIKQMIPDVEGDIENLRYSIFYRNSRSLGLPEMQTVPRAVRSDGYVDFRTTGRDVRIRIDVATAIVENFTVGQHLIDAVPRGDR